MGWITDSAPSNKDDGLTHQFVFEHSSGAICSDWTLFLHPLPAYNKLLAKNSSMEVEIDYYQFVGIHLYLSWLDICICWILPHE